MRIKIKLESLNDLGEAYKKAISEYKARRKEI